MKNEKTIAQLIQSERTRRGWSAQELSIRSGVSRSAVGQYESGYQISSLKSLRKLMATFNLNEDRWHEWLEFRDKELEERSGRIELRLRGCNHKKKLTAVLNGEETHEPSPELNPITTAKISSVNSNDVFIDTLVKKFKFHGNELNIDNL